MATVDQSEYARFGGGDRSNVFVRVDKRIDLTMVAGTTVAASLVLPVGAQRLTVQAEVPAAFSGSPTNINLSVGTAAAGAQIVAAMDVKAQGHTPGVVVAGFDNTASAGTVYVTLAAVGGSAPAGVCTVYVGYAVPAE